MVVVDINFIESSAGYPVSSGRALGANGSILFISMHVQYFLKKNKFKRIVLTERRKYSIFINRSYRAGDISVFVPFRMCRN